MADELMDVCDENNNIIGRGMKSEILRKGLWHRCARVFVYNSRGEILLQLRAKGKELYPDLWDVGAAGHVAVGESYIETAAREAREELGLPVCGDSLDLLMIEKFEQIWEDINEKFFAGTYLAKFDGNISDLKIQTEEVQELKFVFTEELEKDLELNPGKYSPHPENYWKTLVEGVRKIISGF